MKQVFKKSYLLGLSLLLAFSVIGFINVTNGSNGVTINTNPSQSDLHESLLHTLFLSGVNDNSLLKVGNRNKFLSVLKGLIVGSGNHADDGLEFVFIGGGQNNEIKKKMAGIGGGRNNGVSGEGGAIGGGQGNHVGSSYGVVAGGSDNTSYGGVVVGGKTNGKNNSKGVIMGGSGNDAGQYGLAFGRNANGGNNSFVWNRSAGDSQAGIGAASGVLIGTYEAKPGIALVVSGAIKLGNNQQPNEKGEINTVIGNNKGCIEVDDGGNIHVLGKSSERACGVGTGCKFGKTMLQDGDEIQATGDAPKQLKAYSSPYSKNCESVRIGVKCSNGKLESSSSTIYPYCYKIDESPVGILGLD